MSNRLPVEVNPFRLIEQNITLTGVVPVADFSRLQDLLVGDPVGVFTVELYFTHSEGRHLPMITGHIQGELQLQCQRCLSPFMMPMDAPVKVVLTKDSLNESPEQEGYEICLVDNERLFLQTFIEDEVLLALPLVAKHEQCEPVKPLREVDVADIEQQVQQDKPNPFALLKDWKKPE